MFWEQRCLIEQKQPLSLKAQLPVHRSLDTTIGIPAVSEVSQLVRTVLFS